ncbi:MAG: hypothetical protein ACFFDR_03530 [Candidatus Thorarchaeota archaeon]
MNNEDSMIGINRSALKNLALKTVLLLVCVLVPILLLWIGQDALAGSIGTPDPANFAWIGIALGILLWYVIAFLVIIPRLGRYIDSKTS